MASRPVVSYDDITLPYDPPNKPRQPPSKKRKRNANNNMPKKVPQHWDEPTATAATEGDEDMNDEESRELTHEEIWDDSALIQAWNAAMEEYEVVNGPDKGWKTKSPVHKSPLWYNIPPKNAPKKPVAATNTPGIAGEPDSQPIDFDTFVPTHDPSLAVETEQATYGMPLTQVPNVSQDEAFERAIQASYWSGYWTAVYHSHRQNQKTEFSAEQAEEEEEEEEGEEEEEEFVSTQR